MIGNWGDITSSSYGTDKESKLFIGKHVPLELQNSQNFLSCNVTAQEEPMPWNIKLKSMHKVAAEGYSKCFHTENFAN